MARKPANTIVVKDFTDIQEEFVANAAITPGHLVELMSTGKIRVHATAGGNALPWFAFENELEGETISDAYVATDRVQVKKFRAGDEVLGRLKDGENVAIGDYLESAGDGTLQKHVADASNATNLTNQIVAVAREAVDMSGSSGADPANNLIWIEIV